MTSIVTGFSAKGYAEYGKRLLNSYKGNSPFNLIVYTEDVDRLPGIEQYNQMDIPGLKNFLTKWEGDRLVSGRLVSEKWKQRDIANRYCYKFDAYKFCKMVFTMWAAAHLMNNRGETQMIWLDGDSIIRRKLPVNLFEQATPQDAGFAYLGREPKHSETGFLTFRLPEALPILNKWVSYYADDTFLDFYEYHSAYLFDRARECFPEIKGHNLTPGGTGHVIHQCFVGALIDHTKGNRKYKGRSPEAK